MSTYQKTARRFAPGFAIGAAIVALGIWGAFIARDTATEERATEAQVAAREMAVAVDDALTSATLATGNLARSYAASPGSTPFSNVTTSNPNISAAAYVQMQSRSVTIAAGSLTASEDALVESDIVTALTLARDTLAVTFSRPIVGENLPVTLAVAPIFDIDDGLTADGAGTTTSERRDLIDGWVVVEISVNDAFAAFAGEGLEAVLLDGDVATSGTSVEAIASPRRSISTQVTAGGRIYTVAAWDVAPAPGFPGTSYIVMVVALIIAAACIIVVERMAYDRLVAHELADARSQQLEVLNALAPVVQQSVDLGEVLPSVAITLNDALGLQGISIAQPAPGGFRDVFALGSVSHGQPMIATPPSLDVGETLTLALQRGGRTAGLLTLKAGRQLDARNLETVKAAAELATASIVTSTLFAAQEEAVERLRSVDELKTVFLGTASHELRTPVTAIAGFASLLQNNWDALDDENRKLFAARIAANANALDRLVQDLLDFSRLERGRLISDPVEVNISEIVERVIERLATAFDTHQISVDIAETQSVLGDVNGLERSTTNLLSNAAKFSPDGTDIRVAVKEYGGGVQVTVDDSGPGVPESEREHVFSRFFRGAGQEVVRTRGTGIGLAVVAEYVEQMGGTVKVTDSDLGGARFVVWLPATPPADLQAPPQSSDDDPTNEPEEQSHAPVN